MADATPPAAAKPLCFVIGPIGARGSDTRKHADWLLKGIIRPTLEDPEFGYQVKRADDEPRPGMISDAMIHDIINADLVVADLTDLNPNALYELGIRHAAIKPVIHIAKAGTVLPFDNAGHGAIPVDIADIDDVEAVRMRLADTARAIKAPEYRVSNPITQANATFNMRASADPRDQVIADLQAKVTDLDTAVGRLSSSAVVLPERLVPRYLGSSNPGFNPVIRGWEGAVEQAVEKAFLKREEALVEITQGPPGTTDETLASSAPIKAAAKSN